MKNLNRLQLDKLSAIFDGYLTCYRIVPALYILATYQHKDKQPYLKGLAGLKSILLRLLDYSHLADEDIIEMVEAHKNWICYTFHDTCFYYDLLELGNAEGVSEMRMKYYLPAMAEIVNSPLIDWRHGTFNTGVTNPTVLDIGSGLFPFLKLFRQDNQGHIFYIGVDKRGKGEHELQVPEHVIPAEHVMDITEFLGSELPHLVNWKVNINTVFFGNSLHCMPEPVKLLERIAKLPKISKIMVLEFAPKSALNFMFDFHMYMHAGTNTITEQEYDHLFTKDWKHDCSYPTTQHVMHTYTKKQ